MAGLKREMNDPETMPVFEGNTETLLRSGRLRDLYDSDKWELGRWRVRAEGRKPRYKNHRG
jgi:hypothetical protein